MQNNIGENNLNTISKSGEADSSEIDSIKKGTNSGIDTILEKEIDEHIDKSSKETEKGDISVNNSITPEEEINNFIRAITDNSNNIGKNNSFIKKIAKGYKKFKDLFTNTTFSVKNLNSVKGNKFKEFQMNLNNSQRLAIQGLGIGTGISIGLAINPAIGIGVLIGSEIYRNYGNKIKYNNIIVQKTDFSKSGKGSELLIKSNCDDLSKIMSDITNFINNEVNSEGGLFTKISSIAIEFPDSENINNNEIIDEIKKLLEKRKELNSKLY